MTVPASQNIATQNTATAVPLREKIGYGLGDMGFNFYWANISAFLLIYYTDVFGISAAAAGTMMLVTKIVDAFTDPLMGAIADRTRSRFGKFRPYLLWLALPLAGAGVLTYSTPDLGETGKLVWAYGTYTLLMLVYTAINIPYSALSGVITSDSQQRTTLVSFRFIGGFSGGILVTYLTPKLVPLLGQGDDVLGWQLTMLVFGIAAALMFLITFLTTKERIAPLSLQPNAVRQDLADLKNNKPWLVLFALALIIMVTITMRAGSGVYYFKYYVERPDLVGEFLSSYMLALALGAAATPLMTRFIDKKRLMVLLMSLAGLLSISLYFVPADAVGVIFALNLAIGFVLGPKSPLAFSMYADTADYNEWRTGRRATAMTFAAATFSQKLGGAIASALIGWLLAAIGYVANEQQSTGSQTGIVLLISVIPGVIALLAAFVMRYYSLDNRQLAKIQFDLHQRKAEASALS
ncbi:glycoside/pentoside/hexuronide:cation symporter, GPH family [Rheinheimera pacifica]|uniref:Glycoside/pentoside/hexuronide:cation symporter, GPH family n=1 Tax=Rheinheimera pacifica TaxID=173990 RepID=A0A1H6MXT0_9GAMM|nr:MFS transporter [Rheinheimera pacifica]SEI02638.1 glycoside/pentoside/hexuronide:cation symporter, GPH family [Rheinheimera pacifica]